METIKSGTKEDVLRAGVLGGLVCLGPGLDVESRSSLELDRADDRRKRATGRGGWVLSDREGWSQ